MTRSVDIATVDLEQNGASVPTLVYTPSDSGPLPAIVLATEAFGINDFTRRVCAALAAEGYVVAAPDYYRGHGLQNPESYTDFTEVMRFIDDLDFTEGTHDVMATVAYVRQLPTVDAGRVVVWGYCTGGTLALLTACLDRSLAGAVLFFPSQPLFPEPSPKRPVQPIDMLWNSTCPILLIYGDQDPFSQHFDEFRRRFAQWHVDATFNLYAGAGHAFSAPVPPLRDDAADKASWADTVAFVAKRVAV